MQALTSCDASSLVIGNLCDQAGEQNATVVCFYFDFTIQEDQSPTSAVGALLKRWLVDCRRSRRRYCEHTKNQKKPR